MKQLTAILAGTGIVFALNSARAQVSGAIQQVDTVQQRRQLEQRAHSFQEGDSAPALYPGEDSDVGPQSILKIKPRRTLFEATADVQYYYTDNLFLSEQGKQGADVLVSTAQFALAPMPYDLAGGSFAPRIGYRQQWFDFGLASDKQVNVVKIGTPSTMARVPLNSFDFNAQTVFTDGRWSRDNWMFEAGFDFTRLMSTSSYDEFYKEYVPRWGVQRLFPLNDRMAFTVGYAGDYRLTDTRPFVISALTQIPNGNLDDRTDHALFASYTQVLCPRAAVQPYYQCRYTHFTHSTVGSRNDLLNTFGVALYWTVCPNCEVRAFVDYNILNSDNSAVSEYRQFDAGGGVNITFKF